MLVRLCIVLSLYAVLRVCADVRVPESRQSRAARWKSAVRLCNWSRRSHCVLPQRQ